MDPIKLHFNIFQAGSSSQGSQSLQVDNPQSETVGTLKRKLFADALESQRSVRFIAGGKILQDASLLADCKLGRESHICVSISDQASSPPSSPALPPAAEPVEVAMGEVKPQDRWLVLYRVSCLLALACSALFFYFAWQKRRQLRVHVTQFLCIAMAVWVYLVLFYALPCACQVLAGSFGSKISSVSLVSRARPAEGHAGPAATATDQATALAASSTPHSTTRARTLSAAAATPTLQL